MLRANKLKKKRLFVGMRMQNPLLKKLKLITKNRRIKGYKNISKDKLLSILKASEPIKENEIIKDIRKKSIIDRNRLEPEPTKKKKNFQRHQKKKSNIDEILKDTRNRFELEPIKKINPSKT